MPALTFPMKNEPAALNRRGGFLCHLDGDTLEILHAYHIPPPGVQPTQF